MIVLFLIRYRMHLFSEKMVADDNGETMGGDIVLSARGIVQFSALILGGEPCRGDDECTSN
jgi:hypothetical protein